MKKIIISIIASGLLSGGTMAQAKNNAVSDTEPKLFRYKNDQGVTVTTYVLPPEIAPKGYEIITTQGFVLETVKPAMTVEEKQAILHAIEQEKYDKALVLKYGSLAELMKAQKRQKEESDSKMSVLTGNLTNIKNQIESEQTKAANFEREGRAVPEAVLKSLEGLYANLEQLEDNIKMREKEAAEEQTRYDYELNRYKQIKGLK